MAVSLVNVFVSTVLFAVLLKFVWSGEKGILSVTLIFGRKKSSLVTTLN